MVRTQIQLSEGQARELKRHCAAGDISMAEAIRQALDAYLARQPSRGGDRRRELALDAVGRFAAAPRLASDHDAVFGDEEVRR